MVMPRYKYIIELESEDHGTRWFKGGESDVWTKDHDRAKRFDREVDAYKAMWKSRSAKAAHARVVVTR